MMTSLHTLKLATAAAVSMATLALPQAAQAGRQIIPGTACNVHYSDAQFASSIRYSINGRVMNDSSSRKLTVVCPVPRLNQANSANWVRVYYDDQNNLGGAENGRVECRLRSNNAYGEGTVDFSAKFGSANGTSSGYFHFTGVTAANAYPNYPYIYTVACELPRKTGGKFSSIGSIVIDEANSNTH